METCNNQNRVKMNFPSLQNLVDNRLFSRIMAWKIAGSGLQFYHLELAHKRKPDWIMLCLLRSMLELSRSQNKIKKPDRICCYVAYFVSLKRIFTFCLSPAGFNEMFIITIIIIHCVFCLCKHSYEIWCFCYTWVYTYI